MKRIALVSLAILLTGGMTTVAMGQAAPGKPTDASKMGMESMAKTSKPGASHTTTGVVEAVDVAKGSLTLAHDPVKSLNWPAMSMGFKVDDPKLLQRVKKGDKIQFTFVQSGRDYVITSIQ